ncbi:Cysteine-rich secretory protein family protein [Jannaschia seosinensis]|uniref:Cysteine-rich secretory protein family protein n=1 Tax=Jannaschia seosinensis TaxID=313367 RepID=A0A0M7BAS5_9RHOB|nr:CAP domain-containing protein [Jannaschia seosinensis]CUH38924.1 Cysteine-rich secretory protein family protein [Jannaschia seosinensis]
MNRRTALILLGSTAAVAACAPPAPPTLGPDGRPLPQVYRISGAEARQLPFRVLDAVNALREGAGVAPLQFDASLAAAAETHSRDMSLQNRPWHFGSDGSSPIDRAQRAGFDGRLLGETISETYETELETVAAWLQEPGPRRVLLDPAGRRMGFGFYQENNGKIWYTLNVGT